VNIAEEIGAGRAVDAPGRLTGLKAAAQRRALRSMGSPTRGGLSVPEVSLVEPVPLEATSMGLLRSSMGSGSVLWASSERLGVAGASVVLGIIVVSFRSSVDA
jgi:hypothetical protein